MNRRRVGFPAGTLRYAGLCIVAACNLLAQSSGVRIPITGYVVDRTMQSIRPIVGLPGSAVIGARLQVGVPIRKAAFSALGDFGIALSDESPSRVLMIQYLSGTPVVTPLAGVASDVDSVTLNAAGSAAVLYTKSSDLIQVVQGLPDQPAIAAAFALNLGEVSTLALTAAADRILVGVSNGRSGGLYQVSSAASSAGTFTEIVRTRKPAAAIYLNGDADCALADAGTNVVSLIQGVGTNNSVTQLASAQDGLLNPNALQTDGARLLATAEGGQIFEWDLATNGMLPVHSVPVAISKLEPLSILGVYVLNESGASPLYLFRSSDAAVNFVPVPTSTATVQ